MLSLVFVVVIMSLIDHFLWQGSLFCDELHLFVSRVEADSCLTPLKVQLSSLLLNEDRPTASQCAFSRKSITSHAENGFEVGW